VSELESDRMLAETARELELGDMRRELDLGGISMPDPKPNQGQIWHQPFAYYSPSFETC
jgi:hypothetical protein